MRITIKHLQNELKKSNEEINLYKNLLEQIKLVVFPNSNSNFHAFKDILPEILELSFYKKFNQGVSRPEMETIYLLKEIIRWKINPETAMESKVQEKIDGFRR